MEHVKGTGNSRAYGDGSGEKIFKRAADGTLEFEIESRRYGKLNFIDFWLTQAAGSDEHDYAEEAINDMVVKVASSRSDRELFAGFEDELEAKDGWDDLVTFDDDPRAARLRRARGY